MSHRIVRRRVPGNGTRRPAIVMASHTITTPAGREFSGRKCTVLARLAIPDRDTDRGVGHVMLRRGIDGERLNLECVGTDASGATYGTHWWRLYGSAVALGRFLKHPAVLEWHSELSVRIPARAAGSGPVK